MTIHALLYLLVVLLLVAVVLYMARSFNPPSWIMAVINGLAAIFVILWIAHLFGVDIGLRLR